MNPDRSVRWVSPVLYAAVLAAGLHAWLVGIGDTRLPFFLGGMAALFALEFVRHDLVALLGRIALIVAVVWADGSGLSRVLFTLLPFTAYFAFGRTAGIALGAGCLAGVATTLQLRSPGWTSDSEQVSDLLMLALAIALAVAMAAVAVEERQGRERIAALSAAAERQRLARDLHDDLGHHLTAVIVLLEKVEAFGERDPQAAQRALADATRSARRALADVRTAVRTWDFHLGTALRELCTDTVVLRFAGDESRYPEPVLRTLFHAAQEAITNARRHAGDGVVEVHAELGPDRALLIVTDTGPGFAPDREGYGLRGMRQRVRGVGGDIEVGSAGSSGTRIAVTVPR
ncbi:sensor histidine kinase [Catellatospora paridis]|uniref:sensor histidine kinase n=1 Tax=Catellatospora paridis TaxID=1617086 RepID=UPI0012D42018|nr:sensor histidine kinase [Catellatospora paridis]